MNALVVSDLVTNYGHVRALDGVSFVANAGEKMHPKVGQILRF